MEGSRKRKPSSSDAKSSDSKKKSTSGQSSTASTAADRSSWCASCWAHPAASCAGHEDHRVVPLSTAHREAREALSAAQSRLDSLVQAGGGPGAVKCCISLASDSDDGFEGGWFTIELAPVDGDLTDANKEAITEFFGSGEWMCGESESDRIASACPNKSEYMASALVKKFPLVLEGQRLPEGSVIYFPASKRRRVSYKVVNDSVGTERHVRDEARLLGRVTENIEALYYSRCDDSDCRCDSHKDVLECTIDEVEFVEA